MNNTDTISSYDRYPHTVLCTRIKNILFSDEIK